MKQIYYIISLILLSSVCSCSDEDLVKNNNEIEVKANIPSSRTTYSSENGMTNVSWKEGDAVGIFTKNQINLKYLASNPAEESPLVPEGNKLQSNEGDSIFAYYPFNQYINEWHPYLDEFMIKGALPFKSLLVQNQKEGLSAYDCMYAVGVVKNSKVTLQFEHLFSFLRITFPTKMLQDLPGKRIRILSTETISSESEGTYYPITGKIDRGGKSQKLTYNLDSNLLNEETITCEIAIFPQTESAIIEIQDVPSSFNYRTPNTLLVKSAPKGGFKSGYVYSLNLATDYTFKGEGNIDDMPEHEWTY